MENNNMEQDVSDVFLEPQQAMIDHATDHPTSNHIDQPANSALGHTAHLHANHTFIHAATSSAAIRPFSVPTNFNPVNAVHGQVVKRTYRVLDKENFDQTTEEEEDLNAIFLSVILGCYYKRGFDGWYLVREEKRFRENPLPALWAHPESMFIGTLQEAYHFLQPNATGPVHTLMREVVDAIVQPKEYIVDAVSGEPAHHTSNYADKSPNFEDFVASVTRYNIFKNVLGDDVHVPKQTLYYPRMKAAGFTCRQHHRMDFKPAFLTFLLGIDETFNPILFWPTTRFRILQTAMTIGNGIPLSQSQLLFVNAVVERVRSRYLYNGTIIQAAHQRACFEEYWTGAGQPIILSQEQWEHIERLRASQEEHQSVRIMSGQASPELTAAYNLFVPLVSISKGYGFPGIISSTPAFMVADRSQHPPFGMQFMPPEQFDTVMMEFESNAENALLILQRGLAQLNLAHEIQQLQAIQ